jgi:hypothetical protein
MPRKLLRYSLSVLATVAFVSTFVNSPVPVQGIELKKRSHRHEGASPAERRTTIGY